MWVSRLRVGRRAALASERETAVTDAPSDSTPRVYSATPGPYRTALPQAGAEPGLVPPLPYGAVEEQLTQKGRVVRTLREASTGVTPPAVLTVRPLAGYAKAASGLALAAAMVAGIVWAIIWSVGSGLNGGDWEPLTFVMAMLLGGGIMVFWLPATLMEDGWGQGLRADQKGISSPRRIRWRDLDSIEVVRERGDPRRLQIDLVTRGQKRIHPEWPRRMSEEKVCQVAETLLAMRDLYAAREAPTPVNTPEADAAASADMVVPTDDGPHWEMLPPPVTTTRAAADVEGPATWRPQHLAGDDDWTRPLVQVVRATPHPHRAADMKLVVVLPTPAGGFRLRWLDIVASDLPSALPHLYDLDPAVLVGSGSPGNPYHVVDQDHGSVEDAKAAALQHPGVKPDQWGDQEDLSSFVDEASFAGLLKPRSGEHRDAVVTVVSVVVGLAVAAGAIYAGYRLNVWVGLDEPGTKGSALDQAFTVVVLVLGVVLGWWTGRFIRLVAGGPTASRSLDHPAERGKDEATPTDTAASPDEVPPQAWPRAPETAPPMDEDTQGQTT